MAHSKRHLIVPIGGALLIMLAIGAYVAVVKFMPRDQTASAATPFLTKPPRTVIRQVKIHVPPRIIHRHGKTIRIPGHTITRRVPVSVSVAVPVPGPTRTIRGPGGTQTVIRTVTGPTTTLPGGTTTVPGPTTTVQGPPPPPSTVFSTVVSTVFSTVTVTSTPPPPST